MKSALFSCLIALGSFHANSQTPVHKTASSNFAVDLAGKPDIRPNTWGLAQSQTWQVHFNAPVGYRVRILKLSGDLLSYPKMLSKDQTVESWQTAGTLLGFQSTAAQGSINCDLCADNTMLYVQDSIGSVTHGARAFSDDLDYLLEPDNTLVVVCASWLSTFTVPVHVEATFTVVYQFEKIVTQ